MGERLDDGANLTHLRALASRSKSYLLGWLGDITGTVADAIQELDTVKANVAKRTTLVLPTSGWQESGNTTWPYVYTMSYTGITTENRADAVLDSTSTTAAANAGMSPVTETGSGTVIFRSRNIPAVALTGQLYISQGKSPT